MNRKINEVNSLETELPGRSYILETGTVPDKIYAIDINHSIRAIKPPFGANVDEENFPAIHQACAMMALSGPESLDLYKDLVVFHSFLTYRPLSTAEPLYFQDSRTYLFAERTNKALYDDTEIESVDPALLTRIGINFDRFPVAINVGVKPIFRYMNYQKAFSVFLGLKHKSGTRKTQSKNKRLYDQIHLWEFTRNCIRMHRMYSNDYLPIAFGMTILESLIGRPEKCENHPDCPVCKNQMDHDVLSWSKYFRKKHVGRISSRSIKVISQIRNEMYHRGNLFDWFEEHDKVMEMGEEANDKDTTHLDDVDSLQDEILQVSRRKLLHELLRRCSSAG